MPKLPGAAKRQRPIPRPAAAEANQAPGVNTEMQTISQTGVTPKNRFKDARSMHAFFLKQQQADFKSAHNRRLLNDMRDGAPPQKDAQLQQMGMGFVYNLNWLGADAKMTTAVAAYDDLLDSSEHLIVLHLRPSVVGADDGQEFSDVVCEEHATLIREHSPYYTRWNLLADAFVGHGVGFAYFPDAETPWWKAAGWDEALMPRKTQLEDEHITVFITKHEYKVNELWKKIKDSEFAKGWNQAQVKKAIIGAAKGRRYQKRWTDYWAEVELELKENDMAYGAGDTEGVQALHYWVQEFDGSYSFYVGLEDGTNEDHLYTDLNRYENVNQAFVSFALNTGKGTFHSVRGALWRMFAVEQASNRFQNKLMTNADVEMTTLLQGADGESYDDLAITIGPAFGYLSPGAKVVERTLPQIGTQGLPILQHLDEKGRQATAQFQQPPAPSYADKRGHAETKYSEQKRDQQEGALASNAVNRFYRSCDRVAAEQWRRIIAIGPEGRPTGEMDKEGNPKCKYPEIRDFFQRCDERGVTFAMIKKAVRTVTSQRAIGNGSPQLRLLALDELQQMAGSLDETGRDYATRDRIAVRMGRVAADRYKPKVKRIAPDAQIANLENAVLKDDLITALPDQNHYVHAGIHVPKFQQVVQQIVAYREQDPEADFSPMIPLLTQGQNLHDHAAQHVQAMAADPLRVQEMKDFRAALEQGGNLLAGFARELQMQERHHAENMATQADGLNQSYQDAVNSSNPKFALEIQRQQEELQQKREQHQANMQLASAKVAQVAQAMRLKQIDVDNKIAEGIRARQTTVPQEAAA